MTSGMLLDIPGKYATLIEDKFAHSFSFTDAPATGINVGLAQITGFQPEVDRIPPGRSLLFIWG
jgi:hypothetical protein